VNRKRHPGVGVPCRDDDEAGGVGARYAAERASREGSDLYLNYN